MLQEFEYNIKPLNDQLGVRLGRNKISVQDAGTGTKIVIVSIEKGD